MKLISVIIPYYKKRDFIKWTLNSVINQSYKKLEIIIIYDDSDLADFYFLKFFCKKDRRIKIYRNPNNLHVAESRNKGIKLAKGDYIAFIDSDDIWYKNKIRTQIKFMTVNKALFSFSSYNIINEDNKTIGAIKAQKEIDYISLLKSCDIGLSTVMFHKNLKKYIIFPKLKTKEDYVVWLRLVKNKVNLLGIKNFLSAWRKVNNSLSSSVCQRMIDGYKVYRIYEKMSIISSIIFLFILSVSFLKKRYNSKFI
jgi:teichuronic acid biosynthesis glycosyltransferase TuaG